MSDNYKLTDEQLEELSSKLVAFLRFSGQDVNNMAVALVVSVLKTLGEVNPDDPNSLFEMLVKFYSYGKFANEHGYDEGFNDGSDADINGLIGKMGDN